MILIKLEPSRYYNRLAIGFHKPNGEGILSKISETYGVRVAKGATTNGTAYEIKRSALTASPSSRPLPLLNLRT